MCSCTLSRLSHVQLFSTPWTVALQDSLSVRVPRKKYWSGLPCPPPGDLPDPVIQPVSPAATAMQANSLLLSHLGIPQVI